jgi:hypothetical protein
MVIMQGTKTLLSEENYACDPTDNDVYCDIYYRYNELNEDTK